MRVIGGTNPYFHTKFYNFKSTSGNVYQYPLHLTAGQTIFSNSSPHTLLLTTLPHSTNYHSNWIMAIPHYTASLACVIPSNTEITAVLFCSLLHIECNIKKSLFSLKLHLKLFYSPYNSH